MKCPECGEKTHFERVAGISYTVSEEKSCPVSVEKIDQLIININRMDENHPYDITYEAHLITVVKDEYGLIHIIRAEGEKP